MNYIKDHENLNDKKILLRLDLNVPLKNGVIIDQTRIDKVLPVIKFLQIGFIDSSLFTFPLGRPTWEIIMIFEFFFSKN